MTTLLDKQSLTRRDLLKRAAAAGAIAVVGPGFIAASDAAWAVEVNEISEHQMATLMQMARDIYPHDKIPNQFYAVAVKGYDSADKKEFVEKGVTQLDGLAKEAGAADYVSTKWEDNRVALLKKVESDPFFQTIRGGLVTGLYNQKEVWPYFGYEGESYSRGGYINRGFDDISWL